MKKEVGWSEKENLKNKTGKFQNQKKKPKNKTEKLQDQK